jgi:hypothetical protein
LLAFFQPRWHLDQRKPKYKTLTKELPDALLDQPSLRQGIQQPTKTIGWLFLPGENMLGNDEMPLW